MATIRDQLDHFIGRTVLDITSHDLETDDRESGFVMLMFDDGSYIRILLPPDAPLPWGTTNQCVDHAGCIAGEFEPPDPSVLIRA